ncbi:hypothetical protein ACTHP3_00905 [Shouchella rhizosphaerae]|uniref:hypothetical protein n=1 Tax=Shouchella rhizosphaerae TaxID=866786 RepID=UPI003F7FFDA7
MNEKVYKKGDIEGLIADCPREDYEAIAFLKDGSKSMELRVARTAKQNEPCGLAKKNIHDWIWESGLKIIDEIREPKILLATSYDIENGVIKRHWEELVKEN